MNLNSIYHFSLNEHLFFIEINWNFNLFYLKLFRNHNSIYIDTSLHYVNEIHSSLLIASETDYGNLLDFFELLIKKQEYEEVFISNSLGFIKEDKKIIFNIKGNKIIFLYDEFLCEINKLRKEIINDFKKLSEEIHLIEHLVS